MSAESAGFGRMHADSDREPPRYVEKPLSSSVCKRHAFRQHTIAENTRGGLQTVSSLQVVDVLDNTYAQSNNETVVENPSVSVNLLIVSRIRRLVVVHCTRVEKKLTKPSLSSCAAFMIENTYTTGTLSTSFSPRSGLSSLLSQSASPAPSAIRACASRCSCGDIQRVLCG